MSNQKTRKRNPIKLEISAVFSFLFLTHSAHSESIFIERVRDYLKFGPELHAFACDNYVQLLNVQLNLTENASDKRR